MKLLNDSKLNPRTVAALTEVERITGATLTIIKGKKIAPGDDSAGTHDGFGVVDIRTAGYTVERRWEILTAIRSVGGAGWYRTVAQGFDGPHWHVVFMGEPTLSPAARRQVTAYRAGHNGLANNGPDDGPKGFTGVTWESYLKAHQQEAEMNNADREYVDDRVKAYTRWMWMSQCELDLDLARARKDIPAVNILSPVALQARKDWEAVAK